MTPAERNVLLFFSAVAVLGTGARACRKPALDLPADERGLGAQLLAVDSSRRAEETRRARPRTPGGSPRQRRTAAVSAPGTMPLDLDLATAVQLESLPGIGPALAARIVADRNAAGPFGSMQEFQRVPGVGPALARRLAGAVTFSQTPRPASVAGQGPSMKGGKPRARAARRLRQPS